MKQKLSFLTKISSALFATQMSTKSCIQYVEYQKVYNIIVIIMINKIIALTVQIISLNIFQITSS